MFLMWRLRASGFDAKIKILRSSALRFRERGDSNASEAGEVGETRDSDGREEDSEVEMDKAE
jgi:hypothetical protein